MSSKRSRRAAAAAATIHSKNPKVRATHIAGSFFHYQECAANKRQKMTTTSSQDLADDLTCPITLALPLDPVTAQDGNIYERSAIERHFAHTNTSPVNPKEVIVCKLLTPSNHIKNIIQKSIDNGTISGELAKTFLARKKHHQRLQKWMKAARKGDSDAAVRVAKCFHFGEIYVKLDHKAAVKWWKMASDGGHALGMYYYGVYLTRQSSLRSKSEGWSLIGQAAGKGCSLAGLTLGHAYAGRQPHSDFSTIRAQAIRLLREGLTAASLSDRDRESDDTTVDDVVVPTEDYIEDSKTLLGKLEEESG